MSTFTFDNGPCGHGGHVINTGVVEQIYQHMESLKWKIDELSALINPAKGSVDKQIDDKLGVNNFAKSGEVTAAIAKAVRDHNDDKFTYDSAPAVVNLSHNNTTVGGDGIRELIQKNKQKIDAVQAQLDRDVDSLDKDIADIISGDVLPITGALQARLRYLISSYKDVKPGTTDDDFNKDAFVAISLDGLKKKMNLAADMVDCANLLAHDITGWSLTLQAQKRAGATESSSESDIAGGYLDFNPMRKIWIGHYRDVIFTDEDISTTEAQKRNLYLICALNRDESVTSDPSNGYQWREVPGELYVRFSDTNSWELNVKFTSRSLLAVYSKSAVETELAVGLYKITDDEGIVHTWIGIEGLATGSSLYAAGVNVDFDTKPNVAKATSEVRVDCIDKEGIAFTGTIQIPEVRSDIYRDAAGHDLIVVNEAGKTITLGNIVPGEAKDLIFESASRPFVRDINTAKHTIAYLEDLAQSVVFQRTVVVVDETLADLNKVTPDKDTVYDVYYYVDPDTGKNVYVKPGTSGVGILTAKGTYLTDPTQDAPKARLFETGDIALVKNSYSATNPSGKDYAADAVTTAPIDHAQVSVGMVFSIPLNTVTGIGVEKIKIGTTLVGTDGVQDVWMEVTAVTGAICTGTVRAAGDITSPIMGSNALFSYTLPQEAEFNEGTQLWVLTGEPVKVPRSSDEHLLDYTYLWYGAVTDLKYPNELFRVKDIMWTPEREHYPYNDTGVTVYDYKAAWDTIDAMPADYRSEASQNIVDETLATFVAGPADMGEMAEVIKHPEGYGDPNAAGKLVPNPAFVVNKPWVGVQIFDGGAFGDDTLFWQFVMDGGDVSTTPAPGPIITDGYKNAIMRVMRGDAKDLPPASELTVGCLKLVTSDTTGTSGTSIGNLYIDLGDVNHLVGQLPDLSGSSYLTQVKIMPPDPNGVYEFQIWCEVVELDGSGGTKRVEKIKYKFYIGSDGSPYTPQGGKETAPVGATLAVDIDNTTDTATFKSPRLDSLEEKVLWRANATAEPLTKVFFEPTPSVGVGGGKGVQMTTQRLDLETGDIDSQGPFTADGGTFETTGGEFLDRISVTSPDGTNLAISMPLAEYAADLAEKAEGDALTAQETADDEVTRAKTAEKNITDMLDALSYAPVMV